MKKAANNEVFEHLFHLFNQKLIQRHFHSIYLSDYSAALPQKSSIIIVNHSSWWDPLMLFYLNQSTWKLDALAMMNEEGLNRFPFFQKLGAFSVDPKSPRSIFKSLNYAAEELQRGRHIFIFPQGREAALEKRPLEFFNGAGYLKHKIPTAPVIPVTFYHGLFHHQKPEWFIHTGSPITGAPSWDRKKWTEIMEGRVTQDLNNLRNDVLQEKQTFSPLLLGSQGISANWEKFKRKAGILK